MIIKRRRKTPNTPKDLIEVAAQRRSRFNLGGGRSSTLRKVERCLRIEAGVRPGFIPQSKNLGYLP